MEEIGIDVQERGKAYINADLLPTVKLPMPTGHYEVPVVIYDGRIYTTAEHATWLLTHAPTAQQEIIATSPTLETLRVTAGKHKFSRSFVANFGVIPMGENGGYKCVKNKCLRRHIFIDLLRLAQFAQVAKWNPTVFADWDMAMNAAWEQAVGQVVKNLPPQKAWRESAFCTPAGEFLGRKPGNKLTYDELYRYGARVATRQKKTRADKIKAPWETQRDDAFPRLRNNTLIISYGKDMRVSVDAKHRRIKISTYQ